MYLSRIHKLGKYLEVPRARTLFLSWDHMVGCYYWGYPSKVNHFLGPYYYMISFKGVNPSIFHMGTSWMGPCNCPINGLVHLLFFVWKGPCDLTLGLVEAFVIPFG